MPNQTSPRTDEAAVSGMTTLEFLAMLKERYVRIEAHDGRLKINAPAGAIDAILREEMKSRKPALLEAVREAVAEAANIVPAMDPRELVPLTAAELLGRIPLTPAQEGMWLIDHFNPGDVAYNIPESFRIEERVERETLQAAVDRLIERHSILRTSFHEEDGELFQSIAPSVEAMVGFTDLAGPKLFSMSDEARERSCREFIRSEARRAFNLSEAPLARFHLFRLAERRHVLFLNVHHIISDRRSMYVLREELLALSVASEDGTVSTANEPQLDFADYAAWSAGPMMGKEMERQLAYWKSKLAGLPPYLELPHSRPWPGKRSSIGATKQVFVSAAERAALHQIGANEGASPFITFLAVFAAAIARWSREGAAGEPVDFCVGSPITHRKHPATERMIGLFVNMLAFRCQVGPGMSFREVLRQVRGTALGAYENSDVPFRTLVREVNPDRRSLRSPIFQVMFGYETYQPPVANEFQMDTEPGTARYDLSLHLTETLKDGLTGVLEYCTDLFEEADAVHFLAGSREILNAIVRDPEQDVYSIPAFATRHSGTACETAVPKAVSSSRVEPGSGALRRLRRFVLRGDGAPTRKTP